MGVRGPEPTPFAVLKARDSRLTNRVAQDPPVELGPPDPSPDMPAEEREIWDRVVPVLLGMRVLSIADGPALERYCMLLRTWRKAAQEIREHGTSYLETVFHEDSAGMRVAKEVPRLLPAVKAFDVICSQLQRAEAAFGLTPASRSRIIAQPEKDKRTGNDKRRFLNVG